MGSNHIDLGVLFYNPWDDTFLCDSCSEKLRPRAEEEIAAGRKLYDEPAKVAFTNVYFIGSADGPIKIGRAINPQARLKELQTGHPWPLSILSTVQCEAMVELFYHRKFRAHRLSGEWFSRCPEIEAEIDRLNGPKLRANGERGLTSSDERIA